MDKKYLLFVDLLQLAALKVAVNAMLTDAIKAQDRGRILALTGLLNQLNNPRAYQAKARSTMTLVKEQVFSKK